MISKNLKQFSFCKVSSKGKNPVEQDWVNKPHNYDEANDFLNKGHNVGLLCGYQDIVAIDCDSKYFEEILKKYLPTDTYIQKSARRGLPHYVYKCKGWDMYRTIDHPTRKDIHYGEIMNKGRQIILAPSSIDGRNYEIINDVGIKEIQPEQILALIQHFEGPKIVERVNEEYKGTQHSDVDNLNILDVVPLNGLKKATNGEYFGSNPWHGSSTGMNFWVSPTKNVAYCFRCDAGIQPIKAIALNSGIIKNCDELLRGDKFKESVSVAKKEGFIKQDEIIKVSDIIERNVKEQKNHEEQDFLKVRTYKDFEKIRKPTDYLIKDFLPIGSLTMIYSAPGSFKSIISQQISMCVANGKDFLGLKTKKHSILFSDKENNDFIIKDRLMRLKKGNGIKSKSFPIYYLTRRDGDLDNANFLDKLMKTIDKYKISLLILDTLNRHSDYEENSATDLSRLYTNVFMPLIEQHGVSIVFLHHTNKTGGYRGSGDFLGMCDIVYRVERKGKSEKVILINEKNRMGEIEELGANILFDDDKIRFEIIDTTKEGNEDKNKFINLVEKIKEILKKEEMGRKEIEEILTAVEKYEFSLSTLKNALRWMVRKEILSQPKRGVYKLEEEKIVEVEDVEDNNTIKDIVMDLFSQSTTIQEQFLINHLEKKGFSNKEAEEEIKKGKLSGLWFESKPGFLQRI